MNCDYCNYEIDGNSTICPDCGRHSQIPEEITLTQCSAHIPMKLIRPGQLRVKRYDKNNERAPDRIITLSKPFYMGIYPVTQAQYENVMGENPSKYPRSEAYRLETSGIFRKIKTLAGVPLPRVHKGLCPVDSVSWKKAQEFCRKLSITEEHNFRVVHLPTEAQWEYACRAGSTTKYFFGDDAGLRKFYAHDQDVDEDPAEVGSYQPNGWGLYDMHGNVCEWCEDEYTEDKDKMMPPGGTPFEYRGYDPDHVIKGGRQGSDSRDTGEDFGMREAAEFIGFRVCMSYRGDYIEKEG